MSGCRTTAETCQAGKANPSCISLHNQSEEAYNPFTNLKPPKKRQPRARHGHPRHPMIGACTNRMLERRCAGSSCPAWERSQSIPSLWMRGTYAWPIPIAHCMVVGIKKRTRSSCLSVSHPRPPMATLGCPAHRSLLSPYQRKSLGKPKRCPEQEVGQVDDNQLPSKGVFFVRPHLASHRNVLFNAQSWCEPACMEVFADSLCLLSLATKGGKELPRFVLCGGLRPDGIGRAR